MPLLLDRQICESCGFTGADMSKTFPVKEIKIKPIGIIRTPYKEPEGKLKSREDVREGWINAVMEMENISREEAEKQVDEAMPKMPAWER